MNIRRAGSDRNIERLGDRLTIVVGAGVAFLGVLITLLTLFR